MILLKEKSKEWEGLLKVCLILSHFHHPSSHEGSFVGPCLSLLINSFSTTLGVGNMQDCKQRFTTACDSAAGDLMKWCGAELDMVNMYTEVPTPHVPDAVVYALIKVQESRRSCRPISWFAVSKNATSEDRLGSAASFYLVNIPLHLDLDYIDYEPSGFSVSGPWFSIRSRDCQYGGRSQPSWLVSIWRSGAPKILRLPFLLPTSLRAVTVIISTCLAKGPCYSIASLGSSILLRRYTAYQSSLNRWVRASKCLKCLCACTPKLIYTCKGIVKSCPWLTFPGPLYSDVRNLGCPTCHP